MKTTKITIEVGPHCLTYIDAMAAALGYLAIGTEEARADVVKKLIWYGRCLLEKKQAQRVQCRVGLTTCKG